MVNAPATLGLELKWFMMEFVAEEPAFFAGKQTKEAGRG